MQRTTTAELDDHALVGAWQAGDLDALGLLYERYAAALRAYCAHRLGRHGDAEDAVHDTFLRAQVGVARFESGARVWPWLATIASRVCTDTLRRRLRNLDHELQPVIARDLDEHVATRIRAAIVGDALQTLPPRYRVPLYLRHFVGNTYDEIARLQGRSVASVRSVLMRGRRHLGHRIEEVARSERQWPLPTTLPVLRTFRNPFRLRPHRHRGVHSTQQLLALQAGWLASTVLGTHVAAAAVLMAPAAAAPVVAVVRGVADSGRASPGSGGPLTVQAWLPPADVVATVAADPINSDFHYRLTGLDTSTKPVPGAGALSATLGYRIEREGKYLSMRHDIVVTVPAAGRLSLSGGTKMSCYDRPPDDPRRTACQTIAETAETAPQPGTVTPL